MTLTKTIATATAFAFIAGSALAAPCNTGSTNAKAPGDSTAANSSTGSGADAGSKNLAGGQQPASPAPWVR
ncbi:hypothetical protein GCM10025880_47320 [Methylorubrum aminovorans]|nr:hypothetical protein GCM10025880_47320 [Methylorubrum aminovorans]